MKYRITEEGKEAFKDLFRRGKRTFTINSRNGIQGEEKYYITEADPKSYITSLEESHFAGDLETFNNHPSMSADYFITHFKSKPTRENVPHVARKVLRGLFEAGYIEEVNDEI